MSKTYRREVDKFDRKARLAGFHQQTRRETVRRSWERPVDTKWDESGMKVDLQRDTEQHA